MLFLYLYYLSLFIFFLEENLFNFFAKYKIQIIFFFREKLKNL